MTKTKKAAGRPKKAAPQVDVGDEAEAEPNGDVSQADESMVEVDEEESQPDGRSADEVDATLGADPTVAKSATAIGKQRAALVEESDEDDEDMVEVVEEESDDDSETQEAEEEIEVEGITTEDVANFVGLDPGDTDTVLRKNQTALRRSLGKDTRVPQSTINKTVGNSVPQPISDYFTHELASGRRRSDLLALVRPLVS